MHECIFIRPNLRKNLREEVILKEINVVVTKSIFTVYWFIETFSYFFSRGVSSTCLGWISKFRCSERNSLPWFPKSKNLDGIHLLDRWHLSRHLKLLDFWDKALEYFASCLQARVADCHILPFWVAPLPTLDTRLRKPRTLCLSFFPVDPGPASRDCRS